MLKADSKLSEVTMESLKERKFDQSAVTLLLYQLQELGVEGEQHDKLVDAILPLLTYEFATFEAIILHTLDYAREIYVNEIPEDELSINRVLTDVYDYVGIE